jgi:SPOR domain
MAYAAVTPRPALLSWSAWLTGGVKSLAVALAFGGLAALIWYSYGEGARHGGRRVVPVIRAAAGPIKTRPAEPGGLRVPDRDKSIYDRIAPERRKKLAHNVERLIPRPAPVAVAPKAAPVGAKKDEAEAAAKPSIAAAPQIKGGPAHVRVGLEPKRRAAQRSLADKSQGKSARGGPSPALAKAAYRVQIAAYPSPQMAARRWERLLGRHKDLVGKLDWYVEKVDRGGGRGPLFRLQIGPLKDRKAAKELCAKLGRRKVSCLFVRG